MSDPLRQLSALDRPRLLVRAARICARDYRRDRDLRGLLGGNTPQRDTLSALLTLESSLEDARTSGGGTYSAERHISVLAALIAESRGGELAAAA